ncbi:MAG: crossover junction endodeoxyribonuclease RuvC [Acidobacteria bacterium]|nr:crossover junction endodeoxyribonuclease RuvC [Acidobacteriota bacterium]NIM60105.1 crossover junction endodeoxyribonuclease RuvC [Acidobacteriota bacterium]NIO59463.1 crossover junction endodeoxyribonuclease RuvC [Acidobacteriota bacterium]NIQ30494.1 crossover junction endodeoxyribonuclease RuvC [Acidobacteriota bacterium]NIQ85433.1 crossover junction endodeoxyribonuclease RuvC [Acidobacteriota bacterium]
MPTPARPAPLTILGVDPGSLATGWALLAGTPERPRLVASGVIRPRRGIPFGERLATIQDRFVEILAEHRPLHAAVETPFHGASARAALQLAHARGVILASLSREGISTVEYSPAEVKKTVTGNGRATKEQVAYMVERLAGTRIPEHDRADAVAVALCHQTHHRVQRSIRRSTRAVEETR